MRDKAIISFAVVLTLGLMIMGFKSDYDIVKHGTLHVPPQNAYAPVEKETDTVVVFQAPVVHEVIGTHYHAVVAQCDADPLITADNSEIDLDELEKGTLRWVALSRDMLKRWGGHYNYGDTLYIHHPDSAVRGVWYVHDTMNERYSKRVDLLVDSGKAFSCHSSRMLISNEPFYIER